MINYICAILGVCSYVLPSVGLLKKRPIEVKDIGFVIALTQFAILINMAMFYFTNELSVIIGTIYNFIMMIVYIIFAQRWRRICLIPMVLASLALLFANDLDIMSCIFLGVVLWHSISFLREKRNYRFWLMIAPLIYCVIQIPVLYFYKSMTTEQIVSVWWLMGISTLIYNVINLIGVRKCLTS